MNMLIVESAAKAKTIQKYLGKDWLVRATGGHVEDLPQTGKQGRKAWWASRDGMLPDIPWERTDNGVKSVDKIIANAKASAIRSFYLASDPDREGEFIAWRLAELLSPLGETKRVVFHEVTKAAILKALEQPRDVDMNLVESAIVRKLLDRLAGFRGSKFAKGYLSGGGRTSMGRVQTPTLGFVVERELLREAHVPIPYFEVRGRTPQVAFHARFHEPSSPDAWRDDKGKAVARRTSDSALATGTFEALAAASEVVIESNKATKRSNKAKEALTTDALLAAAGSRWGWAPKRTMGVASRLYEAGHITYIRTDSTRIGTEALQAARKVVEEQWGADHLSEAPPAAKAATGKVQDAHEAIRPTRPDHGAPSKLEEDGQRLYALIRAFLLGSVMGPSRYEGVKLVASVKGTPVELRGSVSWRVHAGWEAAFDGLTSEVPATAPTVDLSVGAHVALLSETEEQTNPELIEDATKPPPRFRGHSLIRVMKEQGIGRPSTYASTLGTLEKSAYVETIDGGLAPTQRGRQLWIDVVPYYGDEAQEMELFTAPYTARMEAGLDRVETGDAKAGPVWTEFREEIRTRHEGAQAARKSGAVTPKVVAQLERMLPNAPSSITVPPNLAAMSQEEARVLKEKLHELGVQALPSEPQLGRIAILMEQCGLDAAAAGALIGLGSSEEVTTSALASNLIEALIEKVQQHRVPSPKQLGFIRSLTKKAELDEGAAAALVDAKELADLTGGRSGTASTLIDQLSAMLKAAGKSIRKGKGD